MKKEVVFSNWKTVQVLHMCIVQLNLYDIRALASARGSVARRAQRHRRQPLEGPKGPRVPKTRESEGPEGPRTSKAQPLSRRLTVLLYVFHDSAQNRDFQGLI